MNNLLYIHLLCLNTFDVLNEISLFEKWNTFVNCQYYLLLLFQNFNIAYLNFIRYSVEKIALNIIW